MSVSAEFQVDRTTLSPSRDFENPSVAAEINFDEVK
jgi:hypothetical protein